MNKTKKIYLSILLAIVTLFASLAAFGANEKVYAAPPDADPGDPKKIFCFSDSKPIFEEYAYGNYEFTYEVVPFFDETDIIFFKNAVSIGTYDSYDAILVETKLRIIDYNTLIDLFNEIHSRGLIVIFVTAFEIYEYAYTDFTDYVDVFYKCKNRFEDYITVSVFHIKGIMWDETNACILIDGRYVTIYDNIVDTCLNSFYLRTLFRELNAQFNLGCEQDDYEEIAKRLEANRIKLFVNRENFLVDITSGKQNSIYPEDFLDKTKETSYTNYKFFAMGRWYLEKYFYDMLYNLQTATDVNGYALMDLPVYIFEVDPIDYGDSGLDIISDSLLLSEFGDYVGCGGTGADGKDTYYNEDISEILLRLDELFEGAA